MRWRILALLGFARIGLGLQFQTVASVGDDIGVAFGLGYGEIGLLIGLFMLPGLVLAFPAGYFGRFASDATLAGLGLALLVIGGCVSALASDTILLGAGRFISGIGFVLPTVYFTKMVADWFEGREVATAMSILVMSWPIGIAAGQVGNVWLVARFDWAAPFYAASAYCAVAALAVLTIYRSPKGPSRSVSTGASRLNRREWALIVCAGIAWATFNAGYVVYFSFGPKVLEAQGLSVLAAASVISIGSWVMVGSFVVCGQVVDRFGGRNIVLSVCTLAGIVALALLALPGAGLWAALLFGLLGMAPAGVIMALSGQAVAPERRAFAMGVFFSIYYAVMAVAPAIAGGLLEWTQNPTAPIIFGMVLMGLVLPATYLFSAIKTRPLVERERELKTS